MDSNFRFRASSDYAGVGVALHLGSLTLRRRGPNWNATASKAIQSGVGSPTQLDHVGVQNLLGFQSSGAALLAGRINS